MRALWLYLFVHTVCAQAGFGRSYLGNSRLCHAWDCLNKKLNLTDALAPREHYASIFRPLLGEAWRGSLEQALDSCYGRRSRKYTNSCPGQALLHCTIDQLIQNCPSESWVKADGCTPLYSAAAFNYMFSQSRYINLEENLAVERRPQWFLRNYFNTKCCNIPELFSNATLQECGFSKLLFQHVHEPQRASPIGFLPPPPTPGPNTPFGKVGIRKPHPTPPTTVAPSLKKNNLEEQNGQDPLECCDMGEFIRPQWRSECGFETRWSPDSRLSIVNSQPFTTSTAAPVRSVKNDDAKYTPLPCEKQNCIYRSLNVVSEDGEVNIEAFSRLLDNLTSQRPEWAKAKARVVTKCLTKPGAEYDGDCPINKVLGCTADILSENCPNAPKNDSCKHGGQVKDGVTCLISASKYRPKNRRRFCALPNIVDPDSLYRCNATWMWRLEYVAAAVKRSPSTKWPAVDNCQGLTESTMCIMLKMDVLGKYGFLDYFKMKERIRQLSENSLQEQVYASAFQSVPFYKEYCSSPKKLLNVIDSMLLTCPVSKRIKTKQCTTIFNEMTNVRNLTLDQHDRIMTHFQNVFFPPSKPTRSHNVTRVSTNPLYDFGIFKNEDVPPVKVLDLTPKDNVLVLLPVYQRVKTPLNQVNNDDTLRG